MKFKNFQIIQFLNYQMCKLLDCQVYRNDQIWKWIEFIYQIKTCIKLSILSNFQIF